MSALTTEDSEVILSPNCIAVCGDCGGAHCSIGAAADAVIVRDTISPDDSSISLWASTGNLWLSSAPSRSLSSLSV